MATPKRNRRSAKAAGSSFERTVADYLKEELDNPNIDRLPKSGARDRGDIANVRDSHGRLIAIEAKNTAKMTLPTWTAEAHTEAENYGAHVGIVVSKRHGVGAPGKQWVHLELDDLIQLLKASNP